MNLLPVIAAERRVGRIYLVLLRRFRAHHWRLNTETDWAWREAYERANGVLRHRRVQRGLTLFMEAS